MAGEINIVATLQFAKGSVAAMNRTVSPAVDVAGSRYVNAVQRLTTSPAALDLNGISTVGYIWAKNLDATNNALLRSATGAADTITLKPGEVCLFRSTTSTPFGSSSASTVDLEYFLVEA